MKFLVILIAMVVNYLWLKDVDRFDDGWFFRFREKVQAQVGRLAESLTKPWLLTLLVIYAVPLLVLLVLINLLDDQLLGLPLMLLHILVLLIALDRTQPGQLAQDFLSLWYRGDMQQCAEWLESELGAAEAVDLSDEESISNYFSRQLINRSFERMFVMFFWYVLLGPLAVLFSYISYQLRDSHRADQPLDEVDNVALIISVLEWIPLRMLAVTFSLAGNFVQCFERVKQSFWSFSRHADAAELLHGYANCALSGMVMTEPEQDTADDTEDPAEVHRRRQKAQEIESLQALLERSQAIWLALLALLTIFALP